MSASSRVTLSIDCEICCFARVAGLELLAQRLRRAIEIDLGARNLRVAVGAQLLERSR